MKNNTVEHAIRLLSKKHLLITGFSKKKKTAIIDQIVEQSGYTVYRYQGELASIDDYIEFIRKNRLYTPFYKQRGKFNSNQILDFHQDWVTENHNSLVILEGIDNIEARWKLDIITTYINEVAFRKKGEKAIHLLITQETEDNLFLQLQDLLGIPDEDRRTPDQVVNGSLTILDIDEL